MKKYFLFTICTLLLLACFTDQAMAQSKKKKKDVTEEYFKDKAPFKDRIWYGGNFGLGFGGTSEFSSFGISLYPMIGYKIFDAWSVGPRVGIGYTYIKGTGSDNQRHVVQPVDYSVGLFSRYKVFQSFFAHVEFSYESYEQYYVDNFYRLLVVNGDVPTERTSNNNFYAGVGYNSSGGSPLGMEILLLYNFNVPTSSNRLPFDFRFGITYKF